MRWKEIVANEAISPSHVRAVAQNKEVDKKDLVTFYANLIEKGIDVYLHKMHTSKWMSVVHHPEGSISVVLGLRWHIFPNNVSVRIGVDDGLATFDPSLLDDIREALVNRYKSHGWDVKFTDEKAYFEHP